MVFGDEGNWHGAFGHRPGGNKSMLGGIPPWVVLVILLGLALCAIGAWL